MNVSIRGIVLPAMAITAAVMITGCPLPFDYKAPGAANSQASDPSSPSVTASVVVSYSVQGGSSGTVGDGASFYSSQTTTVTLSTPTAGAVIFYTDSGTPLTLTGLSSAKKINGSNGQMTISRSATAESLEIQAVAIGPNMLPSAVVHATVGVSPYPVLSITRDKATASEDGGTATFTITSSRPPASNITVKLLTGGNYVPADLVPGPLPASGQTFSAILNQSTSTVTLPITGVHDPANVDHTVTLTIQADPSPTTSYTVGAAASASVVLQYDGTYMVTYNGNGSNGGTVPTDGNSYASGVTVTVANPGTMARSGFAFAGWNTAANGSGTAHAAGSLMTMGSANVTLYAVWTPTFAVTYNGNGSNGGTVPVDGNGYLPGAPVTIKLQGTMVRNGFTFTGWNTQAGGGGTAYAAGSLMTMGSGNVTLYAVWTTWSVTYVGNGNDGGTAPTDILGYPAGATATVLGPNTLSLSTGFFVGWNTAANGSGTTYAAGGTFTMSTANVTLYAMWATFSGTTLTSVPQNVTNVVIPAGVTVLAVPPNFPLSHHPNLTSVTIPSTVTTIPDETFDVDPQLTTIVSNTTRFQVTNGALVDTQTNRLNFVPVTTSGAYIIPSVTSIGDYAFDGCASLTSITIPASLTTISSNGFSGLKSHIAVVLPSTVTIVDMYAFVYSDITSVTIPASVTTIGAEALYGCSYLTDVYMLGSTPPTLGSTTVFASSPVTVHVADAATKAAYLANANWLATGVSIVFP